MNKVVLFTSRKRMPKLPPIPRFSVLLPLALLPALAVAAARPAPPTANKARPAPRVSFRTDIEPLFKAECTGCHSKADKDASGGGLALDSVAGMRAGGKKFGAKIIMPGNPKASALIGSLRGTHQPRMPLGMPALSEAKIRAIETWIAQGAVIDTEKVGFPYAAPAASIPVPSVKNAAWVKNLIDRFVLAKLEAAGLKPSAPASSSVLLRRVYLDLVGMPPTPDEAARFWADTKPGAYERLVDRLLADARYGERWGRHWLDLVRYADTHGFEQDNIRAHAWRYRDYVIRALNADKPYDRFLREQIAGDELYPGDADALIATGFARLGPWDELSADRAQRWQDYLNDATDTTGAVMLGMTVGCARCHDHKYDKITQADYYRLQAFYTTTTWRNIALPDTANPPAYQQKVSDTRAKIAALREQAKAATDKVAQDNLNEQANSLQRELAPIEPVADAVTDESATPKAQHILLRGNLATPGAVVEPGFVAALCGGVEKPAVVPAPSGSKTTGRRSALANWVGSPDNPLTARVMVNRLWQHHFGRGIVGTPSDFGRNGDKLMHPELLDWMARKFIADGWSLKKMHRLMLTSATYRQSITENPVAQKKDPENRLLWRMNRIRLEGEALRDSMLCVSGQLNPEQGGPGVYPKVSSEVLSTGSTNKWGRSPEDQQNRRTVYVFQRRSLALPLIEAFDGPDMVNTCPRRSQTTIAPQALALFNGEFSREMATRFAERVAKEAGPTPDALINRAYLLAFCRRPSAKELAQAKSYLTRRSLASFCHILLNTNEFVYLD